MAPRRLAVRQWLMHPQRRTLFEKNSGSMQTSAPLNYIMICGRAPLQLPGNKPSTVCTKLRVVYTAPEF